MRTTFACTYEWIQDSILKHRELLVIEEIHHVVGIMRGGTVPAFIAAQILGAELHFLNFSRSAASVSWHTQAPSAGVKVLLVDDIAGEGVTLFGCKIFLEAQGYDVRTLTLGYDARSRLVPDFSASFQDKVILLPWEPHRLNAHFEKDLQNRVSRNDDAYELVGLDMDGVLLADIPPAEYARSLPDTLAKRDTLPPHPPAQRPPFVPGNAIIITGRPQGDRPRTEAWLAQHGLAELPLHMRDEAKFGPEQAALFKAETAKQHGVTHFYESDLLQAVLIASHNPFVHVFCWNNDTGLRIAVGHPRVLNPGNSDQG